MTFTLEDLKIGERAKILDFKTGELEYQDRLQAFGLFPGSEFTLIQIAPLGDPVIIKIQQALICLRKKEARVLRLEKIGGGL
jgi:Fe2+ transport system protein FeoA